MDMHKRYAFTASSKAKYVSESLQSFGSKKGYTYTIKC